MAKSIYAGINGVARKAKKMYAGVDGVAKKIKKGYIGVNGIAQLFYSGRKNIIKRSDIDIDINLIGHNVGGITTSDRAVFLGGYASTQDANTSIVSIDENLLQNADVILGRINAGYGKVILNNEYVVAAGGREPYTGPVIISYYNTFQLHNPVTLLSQTHTIPPKTDFPQVNGFIDNPQIGQGLNQTMLITRGYGMSNLFSFSSDMVCTPLENLSTAQYNQQVSGSGMSEIYLLNDKSFIPLNDIYSSDDLDGNSYPMYDVYIGSVKTSPIPFPIIKWNTRGIRQVGNELLGVYSYSNDQTTTHTSCGVFKINSDGVVSMSGNDAIPNRNMVNFSIMNVEDDYCFTHSGSAMNLLSTTDASYKIFPELVAQYDSSLLATISKNNAACATVNNYTIFVGGFISTKNTPTYIKPEIYQIVD